MTNLQLRRMGVVCLLGTTCLIGGCHRKRKTHSAPKSDEYAEKLRPIVASRQLKVMHWPNFADYESLVQTFYDDRNFEVAWVEENGHASKQAAAFIKAFQEADLKGLAPDDYDASLWDGRIRKLGAGNDEDVATFDAAMTVCVMRYISDLRIGRVNPTHFNFDINTADKKYNLPEFISDEAVDAEDVPKLIAGVEPDNEQYRKLERALPEYLDLAKRQAASPDLQTPLPAPAKAVTAPGIYAAADALAGRLKLEGDLAGESNAGQPVQPTSNPVTCAARNEAEQVPVCSRDAALAACRQTAEFSHGRPAGSCPEASFDRLHAGLVRSSKALPDSPRTNRKWNADCGCNSQHECTLE